MNQGKGNTVLLTIIAIATLLVAVIGATFAYFTAVLTGEEDQETFKVISGSIGTVFDGGDTVTAENIVPQEEPITEPIGTKIFTMKHTSNSGEGVKAHYSISMVINENTFTDQALKYKFYPDPASTQNGEFAPTVDTMTGIPSLGTVNLGDAYFISPTGGEATHKYKLEIYYPDTGEDQNEDQSSVFKAHISITAPDLMEP